MKTKDSFFIETFHKSMGGKDYKVIRFRVGNALVMVGDFKTSSDEEAMRKANEALRVALDMSKEFINKE